MEGERGGLVWLRWKTRFENGRRPPTDPFTSGHCLSLFSSTFIQVINNLET